MKTYTKSQLQNLTGSELFTVLEDIKNAFAEIYRAKQDFDSAIEEEANIAQEIERKANKMKSRWVKIAITISAVGCILSTAFGHFMLGILLVLSVYFVSSYIDKQQHKGERIQSLRQQYSQQSNFVEERKNRAYQRIMTIKSRGIYYVATIVLPKEFMDNYIELTRLIHTMEKYKVSNLQDGLALYYDEKHREAVLEEERRHHLEIEAQNREMLEEQRAAARVQKQQAQESYEAHQRIIAAERRTAEAVEEQARIAREWNDWHNN